MSVTRNRSQPRTAVSRQSAKERSLLRLVDANANRTLEGLRVCEEMCRLSLNEATLFRSLRALRHAVAGAVRRLPLSTIRLLQARQSRRDIGKRAPSSPVDSLEQLMVINFQRAKESLRTLEECARVIAPEHTAEFQALRFRTYEVERETLLRMEALRHR